MSALTKWLDSPGQFPELWFVFQRINRTRAQYPQRKTMIIYQKTLPITRPAAKHAYPGIRDKRGEITRQGGGLSSRVTSDRKWALGATPRGFWCQSGRLIMEGVRLSPVRGSPLPFAHFVPAGTRRSSTRSMSSFSSSPRRTLAHTSQLFTSSIPSHERYNLPRPKFGTHDFVR